MYSFNHLNRKQHAALVALASERAYQTAQQGNAKRHADAPPVLSPGEVILAMEKCLTDAREAWYKPDGGKACLDHVRKVTALGFQALENHGAPIREFGEDTPEDYLSEDAIQE